MRVGGYSFRNILLDPAAQDAQGGDGASDSDDRKGGDQERGSERSGASDEKDDGKSFDDDAARELQSLRDKLRKQEEELGKYKSKLTDFDAEERKKKEDAAKAEAEKLRKSGDFDKLEQRYQNEIAEAKRETDAARADVAKRESMFATTAIRNELLRELSNHPIVEGWTDKLMSLHSSEFEAIARDDRYEVQSKDHKTVKSKIKEILALPEYKHILRASNGNKGGGSIVPTERKPVGEPEGDGEKFADASEALFKARSRGFGNGKALGTPSSFKRT